LSRKKTLNLTGKDKRGFADEAAVGGKQGLLDGKTTSPYERGDSGEARDRDGGGLLRIALGEKAIKKKKCLPSFDAQSTPFAQNRKQKILGKYYPDDRWEGSLTIP